MPADRRLYLSALALVSGACWTERAAAPALSNRTETVTPAGWRMTRNGIGPIDADTEATQAGLQRLMPRTRVVENDLGPLSGMVIDVFEGDERLMYVVPDDVEGYTEGDDLRYANTIFAVFAVSRRVSVEGRTWRVGQPFSDDAGLDRCECWGGGEITACFRVGTHLRVIFEERCDEVSRGPDAAKKLLGKPVARVMWKRVIEPDGLLDD